jgi:hypothetical protein
MTNIKDKHWEQDKSVATCGAQPRNRRVWARCAGYARPWMRTIDKITRIAGSIALFAGMVCATAQESTKGDLEKYLQSRLAVGEFGEPSCAPVTNLRPVEQGFDDIRVEAIPGAYRVVVAPTRSGWRMVWGVPELLVFTGAGFFTMQERPFSAKDGTMLTAREFRLTRKGYEAMARPGSICFEYRSYRSVELIGLQEVATSERLAGLGKAYRVKYKLHYSDYSGWAKTPEFQYVFSRMLTLSRDAGQSALREELLFRNDSRWVTEREAMQAFAMDAAVLRDPQLREQMARAGEKLASETSERKAARIAAFSVTRLKEMLADEKYRKQLAACLELPLRESDLTTGFWKQDAPPSFILYDDAARRDRAHYEHADEFMRRLQKVGLVTARAFEQEPFPGGRKGSGTQFTVAEDARLALQPHRSGCLQLGDAKLQSLRLTTSATPQGIAFRGWALLGELKTWTPGLAKLFPSVEAIVTQGYGISGLVPLEEGAPLQVQVHAPTFSPKRSTRPSLVPEALTPRTGPAVVDHFPDGAVRMREEGCNISDDGTVVSSGNGCVASRATRGFRAGRAYAEITFRGKEKGAHPGTSTNAAVTSQRSVYSVSGGAAPFSFAGSSTKNQITDGDLIGVALDMDERVLYWHLNGVWMTGRTGSGLGEPLPDLENDYFVVVSVENKGESWRVNFGGSPFSFSPPEGFAPYGSNRKN